MERLQVKGCNAHFLEYPTNKWLSFIAGALIMAVSGTCYGFAIFAPQIKDRLDFDQEKIDLIGTIGNLGISLTGILTGYFYDVFGPRLSALLGGGFMAFGYFMMWMSVKGLISDNYILIGFFFGVAGTGAGASYTAALATNVQNFDPKHSGKVVGIMVGLFGLSAAIFAQVYDSAFKPDVLTYLLFLAVVLGGVSVVCTPALGFTAQRNLQVEQENEEAKAKEEEKQRLAVNDEKREEEESDEEGDNMKERGENLNVFQAMKRLDFWLLSIIACLGIGAASVAINNLGSIVISLGKEDGDQDILVVLFSVFDTLGRASMGLLSDRLAAWVVRPVFLVISVALLTIAQIIFAVGTSYPWLFPATIMLGFAYGGLFSISPTMTQELWGTKYFGTNFSMVTLFPGIAGYLLATLMAGKIYDSHIQDDTGVNKNKCYGDECFMTTFFITTAVGVVALLVSFMMLFKTRAFYARLQQLHKEQEQQDKVF